jgi:hypothetical protein
MMVMLTVMVILVKLEKIKKRRTREILFGVLLHPPVYYGLVQLLPVVSKILILYATFLGGV